MKSLLNGQRFIFFRISGLSGFARSAKFIKPSCNIPSHLIVLSTAVNEKAFKKIVLACKDQVFNYALHLVRLQEDAEDITQEAFIRCGSTGGATISSHRKPGFFA